MKINGFVTQGW